MQSVNSFTANLAYDCRYKDDIITIIQLQKFISPLCYKANLKFNHNKIYPMGSYIQWETTFTKMLYNDDDIDIDIDAIKCEWKQHALTNPTV